LGVTAGGIWHDTRAVVARHWQVFATLAGASVFLPNAAMRLLAPAGASPQAPADLPPGFWTLLALVLALQFIGVFAVAAIAADPREGGGRTLGATLADAAPAFGKFVVALLLFVIGYAIATVAASLVLAIVAVASPGALAGAGKGTAPMALASSLVAVVVPLLMWLWARLSPLVGVYLREDVGVVPGIRRAWALSKGATWPILALLTMFVLASVTVGTLQVSAGQAAGAGIAGMLLGLVFAGIGALFFVYAAAGTGVIYRQLSA